MVTSNPDQVVEEGAPARVQLVLWKVAGVRDPSTSVHRSQFTLALIMLSPPPPDGRLPTAELVGYCLVAPVLIAELAPARRDPDLSSLPAYALNYSREAHIQGRAPSVPSGPPDLGRAVSFWR